MFRGISITLMTYDSIVENRIRTEKQKIRHKFRTLRIVLTHISMTTHYSASIVIEGRTLYRENSQTTHFLVKLNSVLKHNAFISI